MGLPRIFGLCSALLFASSVGAVTIDVGPSDFRNFGPNGSHTGSGIKSTFTQQVRMPPTISGPTRILPVSRNPVVPYGAAARSMRAFTGVHPMSVAASAAITGLFLAMEWYFDEDLGEWAVREVESIPPVNPDDGWEIRGGPNACSYMNTGVRYNSPAEACEFVAGCYSPPKQSYSVVDVTARLDGSATASCRLSNPGSVSIALSTPGFDCPGDSYYDKDTGSCQRQIGVPVIEGEFERLAGELPFMPAERVAEGTGDAQRRQGAPADGYNDTAMSGPTSTSSGPSTTTSTNSQTGDTTVTETSTTTTYDYGDTTITTTSTTTSTTYENGQETQTETTVEGPGDLQAQQPPGGSGGTFEWPEFCVWAKVVCDWLDWTQEDPGLEDPDLPVPIDEDYSEQKTISFGSKSCPPDYEINIAFLNTTVSVPMQPLCDFAGIIYFMVMAASYIIAAYISIGVARNG